MEGIVQRDEHAAIDSTYHRLVKSKSLGTLHETICYIVTPGFADIQQTSSGFVDSFIYSFNTDFIPCSQLVVTRIYT